MVIISKGQEKSSDQSKKGMRLGKYELGKTLGEGNFGKVKFAKDVGSGQPFAVKILEKKRITDLNIADQVLVFFWFSKFDLFLCKVSIFHLMGFLGSVDDWKKFQFFFFYLLSNGVVLVKFLDCFCFHLYLLVQKFSSFCFFSWNVLIFHQWDFWEGL